eukprot:362938-Chlamydomonas_euryale.AAC.3
MPATWLHDCINKHESQAAYAALTVAAAKEQALAEADCLVFAAAEMSAIAKAEAQAAAAHTEEHTLAKACLALQEVAAATSEEHTTAEANAQQTGEVAAAEAVTGVAAEQCESDASAAETDLKLKEQCASEAAFKAKQAALDFAQLKLNQCGRAAWSIAKGRAAAAAMAAKRCAAEAKLARDAFALFAAHAAVDSATPCDGSVDAPPSSCQVLPLSKPVSTRMVA